jgi:hypothetical protein
MSRDKTRDNRLEALRKLRDARGGEVKLHHSTGRALADDGLARRTIHGRWRSTKAGVAYIDREERHERMAAIRSRSRYADRDRSEKHRRCVQWLEVHARLTILAKHYVEHVLDALMIGEAVVESGHDWKSEDGDALCRGWAEAALDADEELIEAQVAANDVGGDIIVRYEVGPPIVARGAKRRAEAIREIAEDNVVGLDAWKEKRA